LFHWYFTGQEVKDMAELRLTASQYMVKALKRRAAERGRSAEAEHRIILEEFLWPGGCEFWERAADLRAETRGRHLIDSAVPYPRGP
jgi:plasmid stability protein